jgi:hypothetical protein
VVGADLLDEIGVVCERHNTSKASHTRRGAEGSEEALMDSTWVMIGRCLQIALGALFVWMSFQSDLRIGKRGTGGPGTPAFRLIFFALGALVAIDGAIRLFGGHGIEITL